MVAGEVLFIGLAIRGYWFGIYTTNESIRIVSWFKTYDVPMSQVSEVLDVAYDGNWTMGSAPLWFQRRVRTIGLRTLPQGRVKSYPVTFGGSRNIDRLASELASQCSVAVRRVESYIDPL
jgi:hypothetical protein